MKIRYILRKKINTGIAEIYAGNLASIVSKQLFSNVKMMLAFHKSYKLAIVFKNYRL